MDAGGRINVSRVLDERPMSGLQIFIIVMCSFCVLFDGYDLQTMALAAPTIAEDWGVDRSAFGWPLATSMIGLGLGSAFIAPLGDRFGRKPIILGCLTVIGLSSLATMTASSMEQLSFWRLVTGGALGACQGTATALVSDYAPAPRRGAIIALSGCNVALGAVIAGLTAPWVVGSWGWHGLFLVGGILPLVLAVVFALTVPESVRLLRKIRPTARSIPITLKRIAPDLDPAQIDADPDDKGKPGSLFTLLKDPYLERTLRLWLIYGLTSFLLYLLVSWLPSLLRAAGWSPADSMRGGVMNQLGGIGGSLVLAWMVDKGRAISALSIGYAAVALVGLSFLIAPADFVTWSVLFIIMGAGVSGAQFAIMALGAAFYPSSMRATGFGWAAAVARIGGVAGPLAGGWVMGMGLEPKTMMALIALPAAACVLAAISMGGMLKRMNLLKV